MKMFVVAIQASTNEQEITFRKWTADAQMGYWHWIPNFWLIHTNDSQTVQTIRDKVLETFPTMDTLVIELGEGTNWAGYGPATGAQNMFAWLHKNLLNK
jgi:hypothetical protein